MPHDRKQWTPNPYAIARRLTGRADIRFLYSADGATADKWLKGAFEIARKNQTLTEVLNQFREVADQLKAPLTLERALELQEVKSLGYTRDQLARVLPLILQITDVQLEPLSGGTPPVAPQLILGTFGVSDELMVQGAHYLDPIQGAIADCYLISSMISLAWTQRNLLETRLGDSGFGPATRTFEWGFHNDDRQGTPGPKVKVTELVPKDQGEPLYGHAHDPREYWPSLLEKAYLRMKVPGSGEPPSKEDYESLNNGALPHRACQSVVGGVAITEPLFTDVGKKAFEQGEPLDTPSGIMDKPVMAWTEEVAGNKQTFEQTGIWQDHAYAVLGVTPAGEFTHVVLRNPLGIANEPRDGYLIDDWLAGAEKVELNKRGVFAIPRKLFFESFQHIGWVNLA